MTRPRHDPAAWNGDPSVPTVTGRRVSLARPDPADIDLRDIAWGLACLNRWCGQTSKPWSVAAHSLLVERILWREPQADYRAAVELGREALLHDAAEAYLGDVSTPLKALLANDHDVRWRDVEARVVAAIRAAFGLGEPVEVYAAAVEHADAVAAATEMRDLTKFDPSGEPGGLPMPWPQTLRPTMDVYADFAAFLERARGLGLRPFAPWREGVAAADRAQEAPE